ncbi:MAG TPA: alpha/beta hydrolase [Janthinobacterium sp.]|nr:alpha/beta hydrolase [Janthinobacterium sp.]
MNLVTSAVVAAIEYGLAPDQGNNDIVTGTYVQLKALIVKKFGDGSDLVGLVRDLELDPGSLSRQSMLSDKLDAAQADTLQDLLDAAHALLNQIKSLSLLIRPLPAPAPAPQQHREEIALAAQQNYAVALVHFATDRQFSGVADPARQFGGGRGELRYGSCEVSIPRDHRLGELEAPSLLRLEFRQNPAKHVVLLDTTLQPAAAFLASLSARVRASPQRNAFIFVHGYKVTFEDAARRTGQMAYDLGFEGAAVFYSWPSQGLLSGYLVDASNIEWSQSHIKAFLLDFLAGSAAENVYLIAHSMGSRALARAVAGIIAERPDLAAKLREIILTAPDIDAAVFRSDIAPALASGGRPVTLYASSDDLALEASEKSMAIRAPATAAMAWSWSRVSKPSTPPASTPASSNMRISPTTAPPCPICIT